MIPAKQQHLPHFTGTLAMIWFISGLSMLFGAGILGYIAIRLNRADEVRIGTIKLPSILWLSTALVLLASASIQLAVRAIRRERPDALRTWLFVTLCIGIMFCMVQTPALGSLVRQHLALMDQFDAAKLADPQTTMRPQPFFGLIFIFILIHAAHVIGGLIQLICVTRGAFQGKYDHEYFNPVKHAALYWHFLDVVWLIMFGLMSAAG